MKRSDELRGQIAQLVSEQQAIVDKVEGEKREAMSDDEQKEFRAKQDQIAKLKEQLKDAEDFEANQRMVADRSKSVKDDGKDSEQREFDKLKRDFSLHKALRGQLRNGQLDGVELEVHQEGVRRAKEAGITITGLALPMGEMRADGQTITQDSGGYGGKLVATDKQPVIDFLRPQPKLVAAGATMLRGLVGNLSFPKNNGGVAAAWAGEIADGNKSKNAYGELTMSPKRLVAAVPISLQNLMQSSIDLEAYTINEINMVIANALDIAGINGSGSNNQPTGILNTSGVNTVVGGTNGAAPSWAHIVKMESEVDIDNAMGARMAYMINAITKGKLKVTKHEAGDLGYLMAADNTINGYPVHVTNNIPSNLTKGTSEDVCSAGIFGDFSQVLIGQWGWVDLTVDDISQKKNGNVEIVVNSFNDILVKQPTAFTVVKDWLPA
jgi:HK97 family phage major capsid protein